MLKVMATTVLLAAIWPSVSFAESTPESSAITWQSQAASFGSALEGAEVAVSFLGINGSSEALEITGVDTSCGCTYADYPERVEPGQDFTVTVGIDTRGKSQTVVETVRLDTNHGSFSLTAQGQIVRAFEPSEEVLVFDQQELSTEAQSRSVTLTVSPLAMDTFEIARAQVSDGNISLRVHRVDEATYVLTVTLATTDWLAGEDFNEQFLQLILAGIPTERWRLPIFVVDNG